MSISYFAEKIKPFYYLILFVVMAAIFFALGRLSAIEERHQPIKIIAPANDQTASAISAVERPAADIALPLAATNAEVAPVKTTQSDGNIGTATGGSVVASKNGSKYYFPWCAGVKMIKLENRVTFASSDLARAAGYTPAGNCKGLK